MACEGKEKAIDYVLFSGAIENPTSEVVKIVGNAYTVELVLNSDNAFSDTLWIPINGYYTVAAGRESSSIFLNKGDNVAMNLNTEEFDESISYLGKGAEKNNYLAKKYMNSELNELSFDEFFVLDEASFTKKNNGLHTQKVDFLMSSKVPDENFIEMEKKALKYDFLANISNYKEYYVYLTKDADFVVGDDFYVKFKGFDYENENDFKTYSSYRTIVVNHYITDVDDKEGLEQTFTAIKGIKSDYIKNEVLGNFRYSFSPAHGELDLFYSLLMETSTDEEFKIKITEKYEKISPLTIGNVSPAFNYPDRDGKDVSLEDLKGKYVYVDIWATWCGPCKREIPHLKQLTEEYAGKDIEFVSISIDVAKDREKWLAMIDEKEMDGIQLFADSDWKSEFVQAYKINGIPRFILIDPAGNIISADAPRPSSKGLIALFDELKI